MWPYIIMLALIVAFVAFKVIRSNKRKSEERAAEAARLAEQEARKRREEDQRRAAEESSRLKFERKESEILAAIRENPGSDVYRLDHYESEASSSLLSITEFTPISKRSFVAFDLETTGLDAGSDSIVEIGAVRVVDGQIVSEYSQLVFPDCHMPEEASAVNHITDDMLIGKPQIHQVLPAFLSFAGDDVLVAHNARFDASFIQQACMRNRFRIPSKFFDTMSLARYWPEAENRKLGTLISAAGITNDEAHRALGDARAVARLVIATNEKRKASRKEKQTSRKE